MTSRLRNTVIAIAIACASTTWGASSSLLATLSDQVSLTDGESRAARLAELREAAERRRALLRELTDQTGDLDVEIIDLKRQRDVQDEALAGVRARLQAVEARLDYLVPRLLAREAVIDARREAARRALAGLADMSRETEIAPELRARLLAVSPVMLERLQGAEESAADLREEQERRAAEHRRLLAEAPDLLATRQRVEAARVRAQNRREAVDERIHELRTEVAGIEAEQRELAQLLIAEESALRVRAEPQADEPLGPLATVEPQGTASRSGPRPEVLVRGEARPGSGAESVEVARSQDALVRAHRPGALPKLVADAKVGAAIAPPPAKPRGADTPAASSVLSGFGEAPALAATAAGPEVREQLSAMVSRARLEVPSAPILPLPGEVLAGGQPGLVHGEHDPALVIQARPGQVVAAPETGRVVFAGRFKRYGLLLMIEHAPAYHTLLWGFSELVVERGDHVRIGQIVGVMGEARNGSSSLHMEVRRDGQPVNPLLWMAGSTSKVQG